MIRKICLCSLKQKTVTWPDHWHHNFTSGISSVNFNFQLCLELNYRGRGYTRPLYAYFIKEEMYTRSLNLLCFDIWLLIPVCDLSKWDYKFVLKCMCHLPTIPVSRPSCFSIIRLILSFLWHYCLILSFS